MLKIKNKIDKKYVECRVFARYKHPPAVSGINKTHSISDVHTPQDFLFISIIFGEVTAIIAPECSEIIMSSLIGATSMTF